MAALFCVAKCHPKGVLGKRIDFCGEIRYTDKDETGNGEQTMKKAELLAPAGDLQRLKVAFLYGADAVYIGGEEFSMRTACDNFSPEEMKEGIAFAKDRGKKVYVALNVIMRQADMDRLGEYVRFLEDIGADGVIVSDLGAFGLIRQAAPKLPVHVSTQANITNAETACAWHRMGAERVVLARELSREEVLSIRQNTPPNLELEMFVHGAMCVSYSGRCLMSNYLVGRDANRGDCAQACRWKYTLMEEKRPGEYMPIVENDRGTYIFNAKDLCLLEFLPDILRCGVSSLKIEGRVKSEYYVATVVRAYRQEMDRFYADPDNYTLSEEALRTVCKVSHREYCHGFWNGEAKETGQILASSSYIRDYQVVGMVTEEEPGYLRFSQRNKFSVGDTLEIMTPMGKEYTHTVTEMYDGEGNQIDSAPHATQTVRIPMDGSFPAYSMIRRKM